MGCWNHTCMISQMHILSDDEVVEVWLVKQNGRKGDGEGHYVYSTDVWKPYPILLYGKYNDYGETEDYTQGPRHDLLLKMITKDIVERDIGENPYHDHEVRKEGLTFERLHTIDHGGRGLVKTWRGEVALKHAVIKKTMFDKIINEFYLEESDWTDRKNYKGYFTYKTYFKDVIENLEEGVKWIRADLKTQSRFALIGNSLTGLYWNNDEAPKFVKFMGSGSSSEGAHCSVNYFGEEFEHLTDAELAVHIEEHLKFEWLHLFMTLARKTWAPQVGQGSQSQEYRPYELLAEFYVEDIKDQKARWGDEED